LGDGPLRSSGSGGPGGGPPPPPRVRVCRVWLAVPPAHRLGALGPSQAIPTVAQERALRAVLWAKLQRFVDNEKVLCVPRPPRHCLLFPPSSLFTLSFLVSAPLPPPSAPDRVTSPPLGDFPSQGKSFYFMEPPNGFKLHLPSILHRQSHTSDLDFFVIFFQRRKILMNRKCFQINPKFKHIYNNLNQAISLTFL